MQVEEVLWAAASPFPAQADTNYDIASVVLRISGLPLDAVSPIGIQTNYTNSSTTTTTPSPATATLALANGGSLTPAFVYPINPPFQHQGIAYTLRVQTAINGVLEVGISFLASEPISPAALTLTLHNLQIERVNGASTLLVGDWVFQIAR